MTDPEIIRYITHALNEMLNGNSEKNLNIPDNGDFKNPEFNDLITTVKKLISQHREGCNFAQSLANGNLGAPIPQSVAFIDPLKDLQTNLRHLVDQINNLAEGNYNLHVNFWGDLSLSFNSLIEKLKERQSLENALSESDRKYKLIAENTHDVIGIIDIETLTFKYISPSVKHLLDFDAEEVLSENLMHLLTPESYQKAIDNFKSAFKEFEEGIYAGSCNEYQVFRKDHSIIDIEVSYTIIKNDDGKPIELLGAVRNITRRKLAESALKENEAQLVKLLARQTLKSTKLSKQLNYVFEHTINAIAFFKLQEGRILFSMCNTRWANALNINVRKIIGVDIDQIGDQETVLLYHKYVN
jgi:PAS domain S-box-containing protein